LRQAAAARGLLYGASCIEKEVAANVNYAALLRRECGVIVPANALKWAALRPSPGVFDFAAADALYAFAQSAGARFRGHTLVWHEAMPAWLKRISDGEEAGRLLHAHIATVCGRYRGRMQSWDVVNEALAPEDGRADGLRETFWLERLGPNYIAEAFHLAAAADPCAILTYNDNDMESASAAHGRKRAAVLRLMERLCSTGVPVQALGVQSHLEVGMRFDATALRRFFDEIAAMGLAIFITELDVYDGTIRGDARARDAAVAATLAEYLPIVLDHPAASLVVTWGLSDRYTWLNETPRGRKNGPVRALPFDSQLARKPAWSALATVFSNAPDRATLAGMCS
jgi:endo-1,4-beta-xylanase